MADEQSGWGTLLNPLKKTVNILAPQASQVIDKVASVVPKVKKAVNTPAFIDEVARMTEERGRANSELVKGILGISQEIGTNQDIKGTSMRVVNGPKLEPYQPVQEAYPKQMDFNLRKAESRSGGIVDSIDKMLDNMFQVKGSTATNLTSNQSMSGGPAAKKIALGGLSVATGLIRDIVLESAQGIETLVKIPLDLRKQFMDHFNLESDGFADGFDYLEAIRSNLDVATKDLETQKTALTEQVPYENIAMVSGAVGNVFVALGLSFLTGGASNLVGGPGFLKSGGKALVKGTSTPSAYFAAIQGSDTYQEALKETGDPSKALIRSAQTAAVTYYTEKIGLEGMFAGLQGRLVNGVIGKNISRLLGIIGGGAIEGTQEVAQNALVNYVRNSYLKEPVDVFENWWQNFWVGGALGSAVQGLGVVGERSRARREAAIKTEVEAMTANGVNEKTAKEFIEEVATVLENHGKNFREIFEKVTNAGFKESRVVNYKGMNSDKKVPGVDTPAELPLVDVASANSMDNIDFEQNANQVQSVPAVPVEGVQPNAITMPEASADTKGVDVKLGEKATEVISGENVKPPKINSQEVFQLKEDKARALKDFKNSPEGQEIVANKAYDSQVMAEANKDILKGIKNNPFYKKEGVLPDNLTDGALFQKGKKLVLASPSDFADLDAKGYVEVGSVQRMAQEAGYNDTINYLEDQAEMLRISDDSVQGALERELANRDQGFAEKIARLSEIKADLRGSKVTAESFLTLKGKLKKRDNRREFINAVLDFFDAPGSIVKPPKALELLSDSEFEYLLNDIKDKAFEYADSKLAKIQLIELLNEKEFQKVDNYRQAMELPPISKMTTAQLDQYINAIEDFQQGDVFLTARQLDVVDRSKLAGIKTLREAREMLAKELNVDPESLNNIKVAPSDMTRYDTALAEKNPFYGFVVKSFQEQILVANKAYLEVENKVFELAKTVGKMKPRTLKEKVLNFVVPQNKEIVAYLEAEKGDKALMAEGLTEAELNYAHYMESYYSDAYDYLVQIKELYGSRFVEKYFNHTRRTFLEEWKEDGLISAFRKMYKNNVEDQFSFNIINGDSGQILSKSKFFANTLKRSGEMAPTANVTRAFLSYVKTFEKKKMLDAIIPEIDIYTDSLTPQKLTPRGLETDRRLKTLINNYINNKKGHKFTFGGYIEQNGTIDMNLKAGNMFVTLLDLGLNIASSTTAIVGEQMMAYQTLGKIKYATALKRRLWDTGVKRLATKKGKDILKDYENFIGRNLWSELAEPDKEVSTKLGQVIFGLYSQSSVEANKLMLLGSMTPDEFKAGKLTDERLADIKLEAGRWRDMGKDVKSIIGATSAGSTATRYKGWAIPILRTTVKNLEVTAKRIKNGEFKKGVWSKEMAELYRGVEMTATILIIGSLVAGNDDDDSFLGKLKSKAYREATTFLGGIDITVFVATPRLYNFIQELATNLVSIAKLEEYKTSGTWGEEGDLKGLNKGLRQFKPNVLKQFEGTGDDSSKNEYELLGEQLKADLGDIGVDISEYKALGEQLKADLEL